MSGQSTDGASGDRGDQGALLDAAMTGGDHFRRAPIRLECGWPASCNEQAIPSRRSFTPLAEHERALGGWEAAPCVLGKVVYNGGRVCIYGSMCRDVMAGYERTIHDPLLSHHTNVLRSCLWHLARQHHRPSSRIEHHGLRMGRRASCAHAFFPPRRNCGRLETQGKCVPLPCRRDTALDVHHPSDRHGLVRPGESGSRTTHHTRDLWELPVLA